MDRKKMRGKIDAIETILYEALRMVQSMKQQIGGQDLSAETSDNIMDGVHLRKRIENILTKLEVPCNRCGYKYLVEAIYLVALDPNKKEKVSKGLYPEVAQRFNTTVSSVDKGMGRAIKSAWELADESVKRRYFGKITSSKEQYPTAKLFIAVLASKII